ncbi:hypothetical protein MUP77_19600 [Candidatus Bathyarchaeota archaeon]|nr:hypothetical protein [Candidatus Bathyarchaeota archaeon]
MPLEVSITYSFQIRLSRAEAEKLSKQAFQTLMQYSKPLTDRGSFVKVATMSNWEYFWKNCNSYIFNIKSKQAVMLHTKCVYGYEGREDSYGILFFPTKEFPQLIVKNMGLGEKDKWRK